MSLHSVQLRALELLDRRATCPFEELPTDALVAVLSALDSYTDLHQVIHASPLIYKNFLSAKRTVLLSIVKKDLGPVIRDAVALSLTEKLDYWEGYHVEANRAIQQYKHLPIGSNSLKCVDINNVISIVQINRTMRFFVDLFVSIRQSVLKDIHAAWSISTFERQRIAQALIRHQILMRIHPKQNSAFPKEENLRQNFFSLFTSWEMEQLAEAHEFVYNICSSLFQRERELNDGIFFLQKKKHILYPWIWDLAKLRQEVVSRCAADPGMAEEISACLKTEENRLTGCFADFLSASHGFPNRVTPYPTPTIPLWFGTREAQMIEAREELYRREQEMPVLIAGKLATDPPYGWVDALDGLNCCRWGKDLLPCPLPNTIIDREFDVDTKFSRWRWMGFMFWDKEHIETLKTHTAEFSRYLTGWLTNVWDESMDL